MRSVALAWGSKCPWRNFQNFDKERFRKLLTASRPPDSAFRTSARVLENVTLGAAKPQAVPKYRFLSGTSCLAFSSFPVGQDHSLVAQRHDRIDTHRPPRGKVARCRGHECKHNRYSGKRFWVVRRG